MSGDYAHQIDNQSSKKPDTMLSRLKKIVSYDSIGRGIKCIDSESPANQVR